MVMDQQPLAPTFHEDIRGRKGKVCVFRGKSARHSDVMSAGDSDTMSATDSNLMSATP